MLLKDSEILSKINQRTVWEFVLGQNIDSHIKSTIRPDNEGGSCKIKDFNGNLIFFDYAYRLHWSLNVIQYFKLLNPHLNALEVQENIFIISGMKSVLTDTSSKKTIKKSNIDHIEITPITGDLKPFKEFWKKRNISYAYIQEMASKGFRITPIKSYKLIRKDGTNNVIHPNYLSIAYHINNKVKIYNPNNTKYKFFGNTGGEDVWYYQRHSDTLLICKSNKDFICWSLLTDFDLIAINAEGVFPYKLLKEIWPKYKKKIVYLDNDPTGIDNLLKIKTGFYKKSKKRAETYFEDIITMHNPFSWGLKDIDDLMCKYSLEECKLITNELFKKYDL